MSNWIYVLDMDYFTPTGLSMRPYSMDLAIFGMTLALYVPHLPPMGDALGVVGVQQYVLLPFMVIMIGAAMGNGMMMAWYGDQQLKAFVAELERMRELASLNQMESNKSYLFQFFDWMMPKMTNTKMYSAFKKTFVHFLFSDFFSWLKISFVGKTLNWMEETKVWKFLSLKHNHGFGDLTDGFIPDIAYSLISLNDIITMIIFVVLALFFLWKLMLFFKKVISWIISFGKRISNILLKIWKYLYKSWTTSAYYANLKTIMPDMKKVWKKENKKDK